MDAPILDKGQNDKMDSVMDGGPFFHCDLCDSELVNKLALILLTGLASACVDNTTGDLFKSPALVAVDMRKEMVDYLIQQSETHVAETVIKEDNPDTETSTHPTDIIEDFLDDFTSTKRNMLSRVSGWLLSDRREDKIDDFVQEMEINGFWLLDRRESIAQTLLKNVDFKNEFHCEMKFKAIDELAEHKSQCVFRSLNCTNEGCSSRFCAVHKEKHDTICPFKILPCEQKCSEMIVRHEMDRHCITICPMKLANCPFYSIGCQSAFPQCMLEKHCTEFLNSHVMHILHVLHKDEVSEDHLKQQVEAFEKVTLSSMVFCFFFFFSVDGAFISLWAFYLVIHYYFFLTVFLFNSPNLSSCGLNLRSLRSPLLRADWRSTHIWKLYKNAL